MRSTAQRNTRAHAVGKTETLVIRVDRVSKDIIAAAARLQGVSVGDYVRTVVVSEARREVKESQRRILTLGAKDQLAFWHALRAVEPPTRRQRELGRLMRGER